MSFLSGVFSVKSKTGGFVIVAISAISWGTEAVIAKLCYAEGMNILTLLFFRFVIMAFIFILIAKVIGSPIIIPKKYKVPFIKVALLYVVTSTGLYSSFALMPATLSILFFYSYPALTGLVSRIWYKEGLGWGRIAALIISGLGLTFLYWTSIGTIPLAGVMLALIAGIAHSIEINIFARELTELNKVSYNACLALLVMIIYGLFNCFAGAWTVNVVSTSGWLYLILLAVFATALPNYLFAWGVSIVGAIDAAILYLLEPISTAITAFIVFGETLSRKQSGGALLILGAIVLQQIFLRITKRKPNLSKKVEEDG